MDKSSALTKLIAAIPIRDESMKQLLSLYDSQHDPLAGTSVEDKLKVLKTTSYRDYSTKICRCSEEVAKMFWAAPLMLLVGIIPNPISEWQRRVCSRRELESLSADPLRCRIPFASRQLILRQSPGALCVASVKPANKFAHEAQHVFQGFAATAPVEWPDKLT